MNEEMVIMVRKALIKCFQIYGRTQYKGEVGNFEEVKTPQYGDVVTFQNKVFFFNTSYQWTEFNI